MGHDARQATGYARALFGRGQIIQQVSDPAGNRVWVAGSDPRADGHAAAHL
jgi:gamma-glutamyltranspeptidase / glutathione hydrolase